MSRLPILASLLGAACAAREVPNRVPLYENLGSFHVPISSSSREAQAYFDQGMRLTYAFNHVEAIRAFEEAARRDPGCAICYWGVALASGPNINWPMDSASGARAWAAIERARELADRANERERALIAALAYRDVKISAAILGVALILEVLILAIFVIGVLSAGSGTNFTAESLNVFKVFTAVAERRFAERPGGGRVRVASMGVTGYCSVQERIMTENLLLGLEPDYVVMMSGWNDSYLGYSGKDILVEHDFFKFRQVLARRIDELLASPKVSRDLKQG